MPDSADARSLLLGMPTAGEVQLLEPQLVRVSRSALRPALHVEGHLPPVGQAAVPQHGLTARYSSSCTSTSVNMP